MGLGGITNSINSLAKSSSNVSKAASNSSKNTSFNSRVKSIFRSKNSNKSTYQHPSGAQSMPDLSKMRTVENPHYKTKIICPKPIRPKNSTQSVRSFEGSGIPGSTPTSKFYTQTNGTKSESSLLSKKEIPNSKNYEFKPAGPSQDDAYKFAQSRTPSHVDVKAMYETPAMPRQFVTPKVFDYNKSLAKERYDAPIPKSNPQPKVTQYNKSLAEKRFNAPIPKSNSQPKVAQYEAMPGIGFNGMAGELKLAGNAGNIAPDMKVVNSVPTVIARPKPIPLGSGNFSRSSSPADSLSSASSSRSASPNIFSPPLSPANSVCSSTTVSTRTPSPVINPHSFNSFNKPAADPIERPVSPLSDVDKDFLKTLPKEFLNRPISPTA